MTAGGDKREGSLEAPTRHPIDWRSEEFYDEGPLFEELERVFDICHGLLGRCQSLLSLRHVLHVEVPVRTPARVEY
jgi:hypothetical protein